MTIGLQRLAEIRAGNSRPAVSGGTVLLAIAMAAAVAHRVWLAATTHFPIGDGGLFHAFITAIAASFPALPSTVSYNGIQIPFAYPPLSFWIGALLTRLGADPLGVVHLMPIAMNAVYVLLFARVLRSSGRTAFFTALALLFFCTMLRSFEWLVMGGGVSRGLGAIFLMVTLLTIKVPLFRERNVLLLSRCIGAGAAVAGAILSHFEWGIDAAACVLLSRALASADLREFVRSTFASGITALIIVLPWILFILSEHGLAPLLAAGGTSPWGIPAYVELVQWVTANWLANPLILFGLIVLILRRDLFWIGFLLICVVLTPRHAQTPVTIPLAIYAAAGVEWLAEYFGRARAGGRLGTAAAVALALLIATRPLNRVYLAEGPTLRPLNADELAAMQWVARNHPGANFAFVTNLPWWYNRSAEWFPVLAHGRGINTVQGREWIGHDFTVWYTRDINLVLSRNCDELHERLGKFEPPQFLWVQWHNDCFAPPAFPRVYANPSVTIYRAESDAR